MISDLDRTLEKLLEKELGTPLPFDLSFSVPDKKYGPVSDVRSTLDCYLYDIREDRERRRGAPLVERQGDGTVAQRPPPARIRLSYCITAWSPGQETPGIAPALEEHSLLSQVLAVLLKYPTLPPGVLEGDLDGQEPPLPAAVVLPDGPQKTSEFWNAIGGQLRPSLDYTVTLSFDYQPPLTGDMVTTVRAVYAAGEELAAIGGRVYDSSVPATGVASAWVRIEETGATYVSDAEGRFRVAGIVPGSYTLVARAVGYREGVKALEVPQPDGIYDLALEPL